MADIVSKWSASNITSPAFSFSAITPSDTVDESVGPFKGVYIGVTGDIVIVTLANAAITFKNAVQGSIIPVVGRRVNSTNTTATNLVGLR